MSDERNDDAPQQPPADEPQSSPFPESSLTPPQEEPPAPPPPPSFGIPTPPPAPEPPAPSTLSGDPVAQEPSGGDPPGGSAPRESSGFASPSAEPPAPPEAPSGGSGFAAPSAEPPEAPSRPWMESSGPPAASPPSPTPPSPGGGGLVGGDPLAGSAPAPSSFPSGYTSPPPPGAGGGFPEVTSSGTPAPATGTYVLAGWWRRVGAQILDTLILLIPFFVIISILGVGFFGDAEGAQDGTGGFIASFIVTMLVWAVIALLYAPVLMAKTNGKTLGRMATGIRVIRTSGEPITFGFAAIREIAVKGLLINGVGGAITFGLAYVLDSLWPLWDDENRALHDFIVNTRVVMDQG